MGLIREIKDDANFQEELTASATKLVVVDFTATWCGPCQRIAPFYEQLSQKYPHATFLKVDVDKCQDTAAIQNVSVMPTFYFFRNKVKIDSMQGADRNKLEEKIKQYYDATAGGEEDVGVAGHMDLISFITKNQCEALNESDEHPLANCLNSGPEYLESDCDEQLILSLPFNQAVKIHSIKFKAPSDRGPKKVKIFINQPTTLDFDAATANSAVQEILVDQSDLEGNPINLRFVKFQNVQNIQIFIQENQVGADTTQINQLQLIGSPIVTTNMGDFKRVIGKKGEAH
ncbi:thioredoxin-like protein 1 isoform X4 [Cimex lectularius]|uniref:Thioredoxin-like protein 1 n=1 Tax=Cimex lectularius TaxID=79782 RepID=A0A8I6RLE5_CIMLE|nr:thioredoxin-like protein 1 isoform X4 [Cimex lectularius]